MSWTIWNGEADFNHTSNTHKIVTNATQRAFGSDEGIDIIWGKTGTQAKTIFRVLRETLEDNRGEWKHLEPDNGWGSIDSTLNLFNDIIKASIESPRAKWQIAH